MMKKVTAKLLEAWLLDGWTYEDIAKEINKKTKLACKHTAKNVRHEACEVVSNVLFKTNESPNYSLPSHLGGELTQNLMNIQFSEVNPFKNSKA